MTKEAAREISKAFEGFCKMLRVKPRQIAKAISSNPAMPLNPSYKRLFKTAARVGFYPAVRKLPEANPEQVREIVANLITTPFLLRAIMPAPDRRPPGKPPGRSLVFTPERKRDMHVEMATLLALGVDKRDAMRRLARIYGLSDKSIERFWIMHKGFEADSRVTQTWVQKQG
jgi:hypothetical protein